MRSKPRHTQVAVSSARSAAFDILLRVERDSSYASELLHSRTYDSLATVDHALATELVLGVVRWRSLLDAEIARFSAQTLAKLDLEVLVALRLGVYQLKKLTRIPARAAIYESVELVKRARKRSAASFVNAVLQKISADGGRAPADQREKICAGSLPLLAESSAHPQWLVERWAEAYGVESTIRICEYDQTVPATAIRLRHEDAVGQLKAGGIELGPGALLASARRVDRGDISGAAARGRFVIQDEASQLVAALVGRGKWVLDCCAAPGGKTLAIADRNPTGRVTAVELHPHRARLLRKLTRDPHSGAPPDESILIVAADARSLPFGCKFDRVLVDVPCSGTGTLARNPEIKWRLTPSDLVDLQRRQISILGSAMENVADGGRLIYSTCSLEKEENEEVVERCLAENSSFRIRNCYAELERIAHEGELTWPDMASLTRGAFLRTLPGIHPCDGFFAAILEKI